MSSKIKRKCIYKPNHPCSAGKSDITNDKETDYRRWFGLHQKVCKHIITNNSDWLEDKYYYFDIGAGPGLCRGYSDNGNAIKGSSIQCLEVAEDNSLGIVAHLFEKDKYCNKQLRRIKGDFTGSLLECHIHKGLVEDNIYDIIGEMDKGRQRLGLLLMDFNGLPDFDMLENLSKRTSMERVDILLNVPLGALRRASGSPLTKYTDKTIHDYLRKINKKSIAYKGPRKGRYSWILFYLTNGPIIDWKTEGWKEYDGSID